MHDLKPSFTEMIELPAHSDVQIAPDGKRMLYVEGTVDWKENEYDHNLWLLKPGAKPVQLTFGKNGGWGGRWSPDGEQIAFLAQRDDDSAVQIYLLDSIGEARRLTELKHSARSLSWSPDGTKIAFLALDARSKAEQDRREEYGDVHIENEDYQHAHLWVVDVKEKKVERLTGGKAWTVNDFNWSPDSKHIAITTQPTPDLDHIAKTQIRILDMESLMLRELGELGRRGAIWSPDGNSLLVTYTPPPVMYSQRELHVLAADGSYDRKVPIQTSEDIWPIAYRENGIFIALPRGTGFEIWLVDPESGGHKVVSPADPAGFVGMAVSVSKDGKMAAALASNAERLEEVVQIDIENGETTVLTEFSKAVADWPLVPPEDFRWTSSDGHEIEGVLYRPVDFDPEQKYPLLVITHGGPSWVSSRELLAPSFETRYPGLQWMQRGAFILMPNYRGSIGYGQDFKALNVNNLGIGDYEDVISGVDALIAQGNVDPGRVGAMGWSQGGYISAFITTYSDRFKAVSVGAGISNWMTYYVNTDIHAFTREYLGATPWDDPDIYTRTSPMTYIKQAQTPTLIQHGEFDTRVPTPNAYELYQGLLDVGVTARLAIYGGMGHGVSKPRLQRHLLQDNWDWFDRYLWAEAVEEEVKPAGSLYVALPADAVKIRRWAARDGAAFRIMTWNGLMDEVADKQVELPTASVVATLISELVETITQGNWAEIYLLGEDAEEKQRTLAAGILQTTSALCGGVAFSRELNT